MKTAKLLLALQDWWISWFGETSAIQWIGLFIACLFAGGVACAIYLSMLEPHLSANRYPSALRSFCVVVGAAIAFLFFTVLFYGAFIYYVTGVLFLIFIVVAIVFFSNSRKTATKS